MSRDQTTVNNWAAFRRVIEKALRTTQEIDGLVGKNLQEVVNNTNLFATGVYDDWMVYWATCDITTREQQEADAFAVIKDMQAAYTILEQIFKGLWSDHDKRKRATRIIRIPVLPKRNGRFLPRLYHTSAARPGVPAQLPPPTAESPRNSHIVINLTSLKDPRLPPMVKPEDIKFEKPDDHDVFPNSPKEMKEEDQSTSVAWEPKEPKEPTEEPVEMDPIETPIKEEIKEEEPDNYTALEEPIYDFYNTNPSFGYSQDASTSNDNMEYRSHEEEKQADANSMMNAAKRIAVKGHVVVNRYQVMQMDKGRMVCMSKPADKSVNPASSSHPEFSQRPTASNRCILCNSRTFDVMSIPTHPARRINFLKSIISRSRSDAAIIKELLGNQEQAYFCSAHINATGNYEGPAAPKVRAVAHRKRRAEPTVHILDAEDYPVFNNTKVLANDHHATPSKKSFKGGQFQNR